jgi:hypothetical protein
LKSPLTSLTGGDLEDGGVEMKVFVNDKLVCTSTAEYAKIPPNPRITEGTPVIGSSITSMTECDTPFEFLRGDKLVLETTYDFEKHPM